MAKALYREYRPKKFDDVLGQDRVVNVLKNQVKSSQISHAYLFAGERGCGKTTCAKIFAKAINCLHPKDGSPCGECINCKLIDEESTMDVVEMDAASNRRIDDIRSLKETVIYPPNSLKYKVYIIDEAHMITREAFNALLKIMEEPPSHLVFILATTEIEKIPKTILSRVQKFEFNKIDKEDIIKQIDIVLNDYNIDMDIEAKELIVSKANGAMRDALSILDQVLSIDKKEFTIADVENILGVVNSESIDNLLDNIVSFNQKDSLNILFKLRENNIDNIDIVDSLSKYLRDIMIYKVSEDEKKISFSDDLEKIDKKSKKLEIDKIVNYLEIINEYQNMMKYSDNTSLLMEMLVLRLINLKANRNLESRISNLETNQTQSIDIINKLVEQKLKDIDFGKITYKDIKNENKSQIIEEDKLKDIEKQVENKNSENNIDNIGSSYDDTKIEFKENKLSKENFKLSDGNLEKIKDLLSKNCSPLIRAFIKSESLNYDIIDDKFIIYFENSIYYQFLEDSKEKISSIIEKVTSNKYKIEIKSIDKKNDNKNNNIKDYKSENNEEVETKLAKIFGKDLIIEK